MLTDAGVMAVLKAAMRGDSLPLYAGLCMAVPSKTATLSSIQEPTLGVGGYARISLSQDDIDWPVEGSNYIQTKSLLWVPSDDYDQAITRIFLTPEEDETVGEVYAFGAPLPASRILTPTTPEGDRTFVFSLYGT